MDVYPCVSGLFWIGTTGAIIEELVTGLINVKAGRWQREKAAL